MVTARDLQQRAETFAIDVIKFCRQLPNAPESRNIQDQLSRSATGIAANYRATCRARSRAEFIARLGVDGSHMWLGMVIRLKLRDDTEVNRLYKEADELTAIFAASRRTASRRRV